MTPPNNEEKAASINIPEIIDMICRFSSKTSCIQVAYSSRLFFQVAIPYVWEEIKGIYRLLLLIPSIEISWLTEKDCEIIVPDETILSDTSRFLLYSSLVYSLHLFRNRSHAYKVANWGPLVEFCKLLTNHALLPNLRHLIVDSSSYSTTSLINWTCLLLVPSLVDIQLLVISEHGPPWIPESGASALLALISKRCPSLQNLGILPRPDSRYDDDLEIITPLSNITSYEHITSMNYLRELTIAKYFLETESLVSIGLLPALERLFIHEAPEEMDALVFSEQLPDSLFPSLRHLTVHLLDSCEIARIWRVDPLVKNLTRAEIEAVPPDSEYRQEEGRYGLIDWLPELFRNSLCIQHLSAGFKTYNCVDIQPLELYSLSTIAHLPLQSLSVPMVDVLEIDDFCKLLSESCPGLRRLEIPHTDVTFSELPQITECFEQLEYLSANVRWDIDDIPQRDKLDLLHSSAYLTSLEYSIHDDHMFADDDEGIPSIIIYLLTIWPNLKRVCRSEATESTVTTTCERISEIFLDVRAAYCPCSICVRQMTRLNRPISLSPSVMQPPEASQSRFVIPEILDIICRLSLRSTCVQIAYSSRLLFQVAVPYVWRELKGAEKLLSLIPGLIISIRSPVHYDFLFVENDSMDLSRWSIYSQLVRSLQVFQTDSHTYNIINWDRFINHGASSAGYFPLPNLRHLIVRSESFPTVDQAKWTTLFLSSHLVQIQCRLNCKGLVWIWDSGATALVEDIIHCCPSLQTLGLLSQLDGQDEDTNLVVLPRASELVSSIRIANIKSLRDLTIGKYALEPISFAKIGLLPVLEKLTIYEPPLMTEFVAFEQQLPEYLFSSLRYLQLHHISCCEVARIWRIDPLVKRLTQVVINALLPNDETVHEEINGIDELRAWLPELFQNSPCIRDLTIKIDTESLMELQYITVSSLSTILRLPLESLTLVMVRVPERETESFFDALGESCPALRRLQIPDTYAHLTHCPRIVRQLKQLEYLSIDLSWTKLPKKDELEWARPSNSLKTVEYNDFEADIDKTLDPRDITMYISTIWPNLTSFHPLGRAEPDDLDLELPREVTRLFSNMQVESCSCSICNRSMSKRMQAEA